MDDSLSGVGDVSYLTYWVDGEKNGELFRSGAVAYYKDESKAMLGSGAINSGAQYAFLVVCAVEKPHCF